jgi:HrpA-like RNA helicase
MYSLAAQLIVVRSSLSRFIALASFLDHHNTHDMAQEIDRTAAPLESILVFLPGYVEIQEMFDIFSSHEEASRFWLLPLHSTTVPEEQDKVFVAAQQGTHTHHQARLGERVCCEQTN